MGAPTTNFGWDKPTISGDNDVWGDELNGNLDDQDSLLRRWMNSFIASSAPAEGQSGTIWLDSTSNPYPLKIYDGSTWVSMGTLNTSTHVFTPAVVVPTALGSVVQQVFTASGTYTPTANMAYCIIECVGGGGGGGGAAGGAFAGCAGGGGAGAYSRSRKTAAQVGASQTVTIGAAGTAGTAGNNAGGNGGNTSVGSLVTANGGVGGNGSASAGHIINSGGTGGTAGTGDVANGGSPGCYGIAEDAGGAGGNGGSSYFGGAGYGSVGSPLAGGAATGYGSGGAGAHANAGNLAGGAGKVGIVIVTEFITAT